MQLTSGFLFSVGDFDGDENDDDDGDDDNVVQNSGGHFGKFLRCRDLPKTEIGVVAKKKFGDKKKTKTCFGTGFSFQDIRLIGFGAPKKASASFR